MDPTHSFETHCQFVKALMHNDEYKGKHEKEVDQILQSRINKFYATNDFIQVDQEHFKPRLEPFYTKGIEPSDDTLVLFGIDFMKKQQLKQYFADFTPQFYFIDQSNCILSFQSAGAALAAIRINAKPDSATRFKVEDDLDEQFLTANNLSLGEKGKHPKEWIELKPYIYKYRQKSSGLKEYPRKLYVRYATSRQKEAGFNKVSLIDGMISKCKAIWENQSRKDENFRLYLQKKMIELNQRKGRMQPSRQERCERSRSRDKPSRQSFPGGEQKAKSSRMDGVDEDLSFQIQSRSSNTEFNQLLNDFSNLHLVEEKSIIGHVDNIKGKDSTAMSGAPQIAYKLAQPSQLRIEFKNDKFNYKKYIEESLEKEEKKQPLCYYDLTIDD